MIGGVASPPFAIIAEPAEVFRARARRFAFLAEANDLAPYLTFLAGLTRLQARLATAPVPVTPVAPARIAAAAQAAMPPIDRPALAADPGLGAVLDALSDGAAGLAMPEQGRAALAALRAAGPDERQRLLANVLGDAVPADEAAPHLFVAAAVQVQLARLAATLDAGRLVPVHAGLCPACGGRPVSSSVIGTQGIENVRYAACASCATRWNEVRIKCLCCGSTAGIGYRSVETAEATVKAEVCDACRRWVKIFYTVHNPSLDPVADDVGSLGLDILMQQTPYRRGGFNPYLVGY